MQPFKDDVEAVESLSSAFNKLDAEIGRQIVGQKEVIRTVLVSIFCDGHCLLVGVPGLAKTLLVHTVARVLDLTYKRIQFTPDLMPSDITGSEILDENRKFRFNKGPVFANIVLADEINRTPPKTQAALLEAMQERSVTAAGQAYPLDLPFFVLATQNPIEQEGTYPLPEAQLDRFMFEVAMDYPSYRDEIRVVQETTSDRRVELSQLLNAQQIIAFQQVVRRIPVPGNVVKYAVSLVHRTRPANPGAPEAVHDLVSWGAGPRASQYLILGAKCNAALNGKFSPDIEDVRAVAAPVLRHRIIRNYKAEAEGIGVETIIEKLM